MGPLRVPGNEDGFFDDAPLDDPKAFSQWLSDRTAPYYTQHSGWPNARVNCVPASITMLAHSAGKQRAVDPNVLIDRLRGADGNPWGPTTFEGMHEMLKAVGFSGTHIPNDRMDLLATHLRNGKALAVGDFAAVHGGGRVEPHCVALVGVRGFAENSALLDETVEATEAPPREDLGDDGRFIVNDPADPGGVPREVTPAQLRQFMSLGPESIVLVR